MRILTLMTDAFGARGGIGQHNRDLLRVLSTHPRTEGVVALVRTGEEGAPVPPLIYQDMRGSASKAAYLRTWAQHVVSPRFGAVLCGHINLLPLAAAAASLHRCPLILTIFGIEAWEDRGSFTRMLLRKVDHVVAISNFSLERFLGWAPVPRRKTTVIPCTVDRDAFQPGPKPEWLAQRYGVQGKRIVLTLARLSSRERYKGVDETLLAVRALSEEMDDIHYIIAGDGADRPRLTALADNLGLSNRVTFAGYVRDEEKADHYRLSDVFSLPGRGEGFGIVYLEALACGVPVIASCLDASAETVIFGRSGWVIDPRDENELVDALRGILENRSSFDASEALDRSSHEQFKRAWDELLTSLR
jgi:phosphatidylinositol alpha-1,6-mannosyltransferase